MKYIIHRKAHLQSFQRLWNIQLKQYLFNHVFFKHHENKTKNCFCRKLIRLPLFFHQSGKQLCNSVWVVSYHVPNTHCKSFKHQWFKSVHLFDLCNFIPSLQKMKLLWKPKTYKHTHKKKIKKKKSCISYYLPSYMLISIFCLQKKNLWKETTDHSYLAKTSHIF